MFHAAWHDEELAFFKPDVLVAQLHAEAALYNKKHLVLVFVMVPNKLAFELVELDALAVQFGCDVGFPEFGDLRELISDIDFFHEGLQMVWFRGVGRWLDAVAGSESQRKDRWIGDREETKRWSTRSSGSEF